MRPLSLAAALLVAACVEAPEVGPVDPNGGGVGTGGAEQLSTLTATIFVPRCATSACHSSNPAAPGSYEPDRIWNEIVGVPSQQLATMNVVEPFDPENSYLVHKLRGTAGQVGGNASLMPVADLPLTEEEIQAIETWIRNGAPND